MNVPKELLEILILVQNLNSGQLQALCQLVQPGISNHEEWLPKLLLILKVTTNERINQLISLTTQFMSDQSSETFRKELENLSQELDWPSTELENLAKLLSSLHQLQSILKNFSITHLIRLIEIVPHVPPIQQLQLLQQIQQLFSQLQPDTLQNLWTEIRQAHPGRENEKLAQLLQLPQEYFQLYQPLKILLQLEVEELLGFQSSLSKTSSSQILLLLSLLQLPQFDIIELRNLFTFNLTEESISTISNMIYDVSGANSENELSLQIVEQPPEKSVYKRNLRPNPMVVVQGDFPPNDNLFVSATLVRCDNFTEEPKFMTGNRPIKMNSGRVVTFRKLKIITTSHQQQETLFCIKFELRRYKSEDEYEVLDSIHSNPLSVLSHSTQMRPVPSNGPSITEVIPGIGPPTGGTRVAVLGNNFIDSPATRIRFDTTDVMPTFHGTGTLICYTPEHHPGTVSVRVCNSSKKWSDTAAHFIYDASLEPVPDHLMQTTTISRHGSENITGAAWEGNYQQVRRLEERGTDVNSVDNRSYTALQYACSQGFTDICSFLLESEVEVDYQDKYGSTALYWASVFNQLEIVEILVEHGANMNLCNFQGQTPLIASILEGHTAMAEYLVDSGASIHSAPGTISPLHAVAAVGIPELAVKLVQSGCFLNAQDEEGDTPLHWAVREGNHKIVQILSKSRMTQLDIPNEDLETPLHIAATIDDTISVNLLLSHGADPNKVDQDGHSPLHDAILAGNLYSAQALVQHGAQINLRDKFGITPKELALKLLHQDISLWTPCQVFQLNDALSNEICSGTKTSKHWGLETNIVSPLINSIAHAQ